MWWLVVPVFALLVVLTWQQYRQGLADAERGLLRRAEERAQELEALARPAEAHVHDLRRLLETQWASPPKAPLDVQRLMSRWPDADVGSATVRQSSIDGWTLDKATPEMRQIMGQIWWAPADGSPPRADWLNRAALFMRTARVAHERAPGFQGSYFVAGEANISWGYPWIATPTMLQAMGVPSLQSLERMRLAGVERGRRDVAENPNQLTYWGPPYVGQLDGDLVQSHGSIILANGEYAGEVSVDFRIDGLQRIAAKWQDREGSRVWVVNRDGLVIADSAQPLEAPPPQGTANQRLEIPLQSRLSPSSAEVLTALLPAPANGTLKDAGPDVLLAAARSQSPWVYVASVPRASLRAEVLPSLIPNALLGLALLLVFVGGQWLFARWVVTPAVAVLQYLRARSENPRTPQPLLGPRWQGWIRAINQVFDRQEEAQQQLDAQRESLRQNEKLSAMGTLLAGVAHELNNPLAIVVGRASLLEEHVHLAARSPSPETLQSLEEGSRRIREAAARSARIVRTFLNMARQRPATRTAVQLDDVVRSALDMLGYTLRSRNIQVELAMDPQTPAVQADADQLGQVALNLIVNAQQALEAIPGERRLTISLGYSAQPMRTRFESKVPHVWLRFTDNGAGVPETLRDRLFEPFFTTKMPGQGTGLGLSVSRNMAREHGGDLILLPSESGASFQLMLPVEAPDAAQTTPTEVLAHTSVDTVPRILVVDDEPDLVDVIRATLETAGYDVASAESGAVALELIAEARFDAVLSDMRMPDMDGRMLWRALRERNPALAQRTLFVTGDTLSPDARAMLRETGCASLDKPFERDELLSALQRLLRQGG
jgi:signal transduction histidine kinase/ActR/RegA family two-component response regulator